MPKHLVFARALAILSTSLLISLPVLGADDGMKVTDNGYLDTRGFSVILYQSTYHPVFVDQKNTAMELILHGQRVATNGDVRLMRRSSGIWWRSSRDARPIKSTTV